MYINILIFYSYPSSHVQIKFEDKISLICNNGNLGDETENTQE